MAQITLVEAVNLALARAMADDPEVIVLGEDVGRDGGVFRATLGLLEKFGPERVLDTPPPPVEQMFDHLYATLPAAFAPQRAALLASTAESAQ
jgi:hypothetical protein